MVQTGLARVLGGDNSLLRGKRVGLIANPTTVDAELRHAVDLFHADPNIDLRVLLGPEHGLRGDAQDMITVDDAMLRSQDRDELRNLLTQSTVSANARKRSSAA